MPGRGLAVKSALVKDDFCDMRWYRRGATEVGALHHRTSEAEVGGALGAIYDCALGSEHWPAALERLARLFHCSFADDFTRTHDRSRYRGIAYGLDDADYQDLFLDTWSKRNVWSARRPVTTAGEVLTTREILSKSELVRTEMYHEYLAARGLHEGMRIAIWSGAEGIEDISLLRPWSMGPFAAAEIALAERLLPHLRRAAAISRRLEASETTAMASVSALDRVHQPLLLLDAGGRVVHANPAGLDVLRRADGLQAGPGGLSGATQAVTSRLQAVLRRAGGSGGRPISGTMRLPRRSGQPALALIAVPLNQETGWRTPQRAAVLACVADPSASHALPDAHLAALFGLTPAETALANDLLQGDDPAGIARRTGRSIHTVRTHLARLMAKTGTARQSELVRLLLAFPRETSDG